MVKRLKPKSMAKLLYSDDECVQRLAALLEHQDSRNLQAIARLISRLAVPIE
jgi:hypothetical protein